jgi:ABC-type transport system involved in multi-copper enzyme maturation permease subunit
LKLLGPVFCHDLVGLARRQRLTLRRVVYAALLLIAILILYVEKLPYTYLFDSSRASPAQMREFAESFFAAFITVQFAAVILFMPALTANALAEERSNRTLEFLLTTQLTNPEIIASKLLTRFLQVGLLVLTGLPVLAIMQLFGGIDPTMLVGAFLAVAALGLSLGCVGLVCGLRVKKVQNAGWRAYQIIIAYAAVSALLIWYFQLPFGRGTGWAWLAVPGGRPTMANVAVFAPPTHEWWQSLLEAFNAGNPYFAYLRVYYEQVRNTPFSQALLLALRDFIIFHGVVAFVAAGYAVLRLRAIAARQNAGLVPKKIKYLKAAPHPPIRNRPMLWKEIYCEARPRQRWLALFFSRWFFFVSFLPAWIVFLLVLDDSYSKLAEYTVFFLRVGCTLVACLLCLRVAMQAARSIAGERERETMDSLLTTELTPGEIVWSKWWGAFLNCRWILLWLLVHWGLGVLTFSVAWYSVPVLTIETIIFAAFSVSVGMLCAASFRSSKQAVNVTLLVLILGTTIAPWLGGKILTLVPGLGGATVRGRWGYETKPWAELQARALSPPFALYDSVVRQEGLHHWRDYYGEASFNELALFLFVSLSLYLLMAVFLAVLATRLFRAQIRGRSSRFPRANSSQIERDETLQPHSTVSTA